MIYKRNFSSNRSNSPSNKSRRNKELFSLFLINFCYKRGSSWLISRHFIPYSHYSDMALLKNCPINPSPTLLCNCVATEITLHPFCIRRLHLNSSTFSYTSFWHARVVPATFLKESSSYKPLKPNFYLFFFLFLCFCLVEFAGLENWFGGGGADFRLNYNPLINVLWSFPVEWWRKIKKAGEGGSFN